MSVVGNFPLPRQGYILCKDHFDELKAVAKAESNFNPKAIGPKTKYGKAQGMMQIMPRFHPDVDYLNPNEAIPYAGQYLSVLKNEFGTWRLALAAYNHGPGNVNKVGKTANGFSEEKYWRNAPKETRNYINKILNQ